MRPANVSGNAQVIFWPIGHIRVPKKSHFQSEAKCEAIDTKIIFSYDANKTHFHNKGFALSLVLKVRFFGTRKWPIVSLSLIIVPELFAKVNSSQFPFRF